MPRNNLERDDQENDSDFVEPVRKSNGIAKVALILGFSSFLFTCLTGIPAIICGIIGLSRSKVTRTGSGASIAGIILGSFGMLFSMGMIIFFGLVVGVGKVRNARERLHDQNNYKMMGLALHNYHDSNFQIPQSSIKHDNGHEPGLSWRVSILSYIDYGYINYEPKKAWNEGVNQIVLSQPIRCYNSLQDDPSMTHSTRVQGFVGEGTMFDPTKKLRFHDVKDGLSNTIFVAQSSNLVRWAEPKDMPFDKNAPLPPLGSADPKYSAYIVCLADGSVRVVSKSVNSEILKNWITISDGKVALPLD
jgi:hypothetical protein